MTPQAPVAGSQSSALRDFVDAVHVLSDEPRPANVERYLAASRALEDSRPPRRTPLRPRTRSRDRHGRTATPTSR